MPNTASNFPALMNNSVPVMGVTRPNACSTITSVSPPRPCPAQRGKNCSRVNAMMGARCDR